MKCPNPSCDSDDTTFSRDANPCLAWCADRIKELEAERVVREARYLRERGLWREYATMLVKELSGHVGLAMAHGWKGDEDAYRIGTTLRDALGLTHDGTHSDKEEVAK